MVVKVPNHVALFGFAFDGVGISNPANRNHL